MTEAFSDDVPEFPTLAGLIRKVLADNLDIHKNQELADRVFEATPQHLIPKFYRQALTANVPIVNAAVRNTKPAETMEERPVRSGRFNRSRRMQDIAENNWYQQQLDARIGVPGDGSVPFKFCTISQIESYADSVISAGQAQITNGKKYEALAKIARDRGYETGADFPEDVLREVLG